MALLDSRGGEQDGDCSDSPPSSAASEDVVEIGDSEVSLTRLQGAVRVLLRGIGEDITREGLRDTPKRVAKAWVEATEGYRQNVHRVLGGALFHEDFSSSRDNSLVLIQDVEFASTSEHNLLPFFGRCHIAYVPRSGVVLGLSKVARLAKMFARRLQNQQHLTDDILEAFSAEVQPLGCAAIVEACHLGAEGRESHATVSALGCFLEKPAIFLQEFFSLLGRADLSLPVSLPPVSDASGPGLHNCSCCGCCSTAGTALPLSPLRWGQGSSSIDRQREEGMAAAVELILREVGEDPSRKGLQGTVQRYVQHLLACSSALTQAPSDMQHACSPPLGYSGLWSEALADEFQLDFTSQCEHHLLPFQGIVQIICLPGPSGEQLSRVRARAVTQAFSRRLQIQERLTHQVAGAIHTALQAAGTLVLCRAAHMCMVARGVEKHASSTVTMAAYGIFETEHVLRGQAVQRLQRSQRMLQAAHETSMVGY